MLVFDEIQSSIRSKYNEIKKKNHCIHLFTILINNKTLKNNNVEQSMNSLSIIIVIIVDFYCLENTC